MSSDNDYTPCTNTQVLTNLMEFARTGPIMQMFIMDALSKRADAIVAAGIDKVREAFGPNNMVSPDAWFAAAQELKAALDRHLGGN